MRRGLQLFGIAAVIALTSAGWAQDRDETQVGVAVRRGVSFLKGHQSADGSWPYSGHELGITALAGLALTENGVPIDDKSIQSALSFVRGAAPGNSLTYDLSLSILFLVRVNDKTDVELIRLLGARLVAGQLSTGGWTYSCPLVMQTPPSVRNRSSPPAGNSDGRRPGRLATGPMRTGYGDNSNTQFAVLGIWSAGRA